MGVSKHAIKKAVELRGETCGDRANRCFFRAPLHELPFADEAFDIGLSADVLEHISEPDLPKVFYELWRVVRAALILRISVREEAEGNGEKHGFSNLHYTIKDAEWWAASFAQLGWYPFVNLDSAFWIGTADIIL